MSDQGASGRSRLSSAPSGDVSRPILRPGSRPPSPAYSVPGGRPPSPALHIRTLTPSPASSSSFYGFSDVPSVPPPRPVSHPRPPPAVPPRADQFNILPRRPTYFRYVTQSAQTPSGFFNPRPIVFDQAVQTDPSMRPSDRQGPRSPGPLKGHQRSSGAGMSPTTLPGYSRAVVAAPRPSPIRPLVIPTVFRPLVTGVVLPSPMPVTGLRSSPAVAPTESPPPRVWTISPSSSGTSFPEAQQSPSVPPTDPVGAARPARPALPTLPGSEPPPPPYETAISWPASLRFIRPAGAPTTTSSASSSAAVLETPPRNAPPLWPVIPPLPGSSTAAGSSTPTDSPAGAASSAPPPSYAEVVSGAVSPGGSSSSGLLGRVTSPPATTTTVPSSSSPLSTQVRFQIFALIFVPVFLALRSLFCAPLSYLPVYAPVVFLLEKLYGWSFPLTMFVYLSFRPFCLLSISHQPFFVDTLDSTLGIFFSVSLE